MTETEKVLVSSSDLSAMRALITTLHGTVQQLVDQQSKSGAPAKEQFDENGYRPLTEKEREYRITRMDVQAILGVSERTTYRRIKDYNIVSIEENGDTKFILGELLDIISRHGLNWHRPSLNRLLSKREIKCKPCYV